MFWQTSLNSNKNPYANGFDKLTAGKLAPAFEFEF